MILLVSILAGVVVALSVLYSAVRPGLQADPSEAGMDAGGVYRQYCSPCHGPEGGGTNVGPRLRGRNLDVDYVRKMILSGTVKMPPIRNLHDPVLTNVAVFVKELP